MWWLYTHDCATGRWSLITSQEGELPAPGKPLEIPAELRAAGGHFYTLGFHVGLRYTTASNASPQAILMNPAATMLRVVSLTVTKPWNCRYEEPAESHRPFVAVEDDPDDDDD